MIENQRIFYSDNGTLRDMSVNLNNFASGTEVIPLVATEDYIYIATDMPFNHKYFLVSTPNDVTSVVSVDIWWSRTWDPAFDVIDQTNGFKNSGILQWTSNRLHGWSSELDSQDVTGISVIGLYNMYWLRLKVSVSLKATTALQFVGNKFSNDTVLAAYYPDLSNSNLKTAFAAGKTTWDDQHFIASETIVRDLQKRNIIISQNQILSYEILKEAACHKVAEIIYTALGRSYDENRKQARKYYDETLNVKKFEVDLDADGRLSDCEKTNSTGYMTR
jgi:hypothetical protein